MAEHAELVKEMIALESLSSQERLKLAKKRRQQQLKKFNDYDKKHEKQEKQAIKRKTKAASAIISTNTETVNSHAKTKTNSYQHARNTTIKRKRNIMFEKGVMLLEAAARNDVGEVRKLLEQGVSPDVANEDGLTALHQCCIDDSEEMVLVLLKHGANVNSRDSELWTPLHAASTCGHLRICQHLMDKEADLLSVNADGNMPYDICEDEETLEFIETQMAHHGVTQELIDEMRLSTEKKMLDDIKEFEREGHQVSSWVDRTGASLLHIAAANGYYEVSTYLLTKRFDVNETDNDSWTPAMAAACWGQISVLELLAQNGADLDVKTKDNKALVDLVDDQEVKNQISEIKQEVKVSVERFKRDNTDVRRRSSTNIRSSMGSGSIYNSNTSLTDKNPFSSSVRRHSMREKHKLSIKEARDEARFRISINTEDITPLTSPDGASAPSPPSSEIPSIDAPVTNIDDIDMTVSDNNITTVNVGGGSAVPNGDLQDTAVSVDTENSNNKTPPKPSATIQITPDDESPPPQRLPGDGQETTPEQLSDEHPAEDNAQQNATENHQSLMNGKSQQAGGDVNDKTKLTIDSTADDESNLKNQTDVELKPVNPGNDAGGASPSPARSKSILKDPPMKRYSGAPAAEFVNEGGKDKSCCTIL